jgi:hypothetical protein
LPPVSESQAEPPSAQAAQPTAEQLVAELQKIKVADLLVHTTSMLASLAYGKLAPETRDLADAQLAIESLRALVPLLPEEQRGSLQQVVSNLQLAYADAAAG